ncbi:MAG: type I glutamate--ammonia ligase, partial [Planctomycetota bacterium]|nr:type I glutamate--ammonia ligase [Planctomycetota bacterium]
DAADLATIPKVPASLGESVSALEADHEFLTAGGVFTEDLVNSWISWKRQEELEPMALRPHPHEFNLYYDS